MLSEKNPSKRTTILFIVLIVMVIAAILFYIYSRTFLPANRAGVDLTPATFRTLLSMTVPLIIGIVLVSIVIGFVSLNFQTITGSRILTPAMLGFDAIFTATQVLIILFLGAAHVIFINQHVNFFISAAVMVFVSVLLFSIMLRKNSNNLVLLLLFGLILSGVVRSFTNWIIITMSADDFSHVQSATLVTIDNMNTAIIPIIAPIMLGLAFIMLYKSKTYDAISLGEANAKNLGVTYNKEFKIGLILIAIGMALTTALVGPVTFLGLLAVNISRELFKTYKHKTLFIASSLVAMFALIFGQALVEVFQHAIPVTVIIDLVGCIYLFYLIIKENKKI